MADDADLRFVLICGLHGCESQLLPSLEACQRVAAWWADRGCQATVLWEYQAVAERMFTWQPEIRTVEVRP